MTSPAERWARVQHILHEALELPVADRAAYLARACGGDEGLAGEVEALLAALHEGPLGEPVDEPKLFGLPAERVGPYRILRPLGRGGMGAVYLAERTTGDVTQVVALKLLRTDFAAPQLVARFAAERRILARLAHPGIARLIDAGTTEDGQPYFAMEFVDGVDLTAWARSRRLGVADRVQLLLAVCEAVDYAHRQLVVHRDLKPSNILVADDGRPRLLDFGVAKLIESDEAGGATRTLHWLTPEYASPEQVRGDPVGPAADIYAIGILLYELLTGTRPFTLADLSPAAIEQVVCHEPPQRPSERITSRRLRRLVRGDLDTITLKALAKQPDRRYASVRELAEDLRRHLAREPVRARPDTFAYRAVSFARRHRTAVAAAALALVSLVGGLAAVGWQAARATRERDRAEEALGSSQEVLGFLVGMFEATDPAEHAGDTAVARIIVRRGVQRAEALSEQPLAQARVLDALGMVYVSLGQYDTAWTLVTRALDERRAHLNPRHPDVVASLLNLGRIERRRSHYREAEAAYLEALSLQRGSRDRDHAQLITTLDRLGFLMPYLGREIETERYYREALALTERYFPDDETQIANQITVVAAAVGRRGSYDEAVSLMRDALAHRRRVPGGEAETGQTMIQLADELQQTAHPGGEPERLYRAGLDLQRAALGDRHVRLVHGLGNLASLLSEAGRHVEAEQLLREALAIRLGALGPDHPNCAASYDALGEELGLQGRFGEALTMHRQGLDLWRRALGEEHAAVAGSMAGLARTLARAGRYAEAEQLLREALAMRARLHGPGHVLIGVLLSDLGKLLTQENRLTAAEATLRRALLILRAHQLPTHRDVRTAHARLAEVYTGLGRPAEAARQRAAAGM